MGGMLIWSFQVMPVFFLIGGHADALSWTAHHAQGGALDLVDTAPGDGAGVADRRVPGCSGLALAAARAAGSATANIALVGRLASLQLWFPPVYLALITLTPVMFAAHRRWAW